MFSKRGRRRGGWRNKNWKEIKGWKLEKEGNVFPDFVVKSALTFKHHPLSFHFFFSLLLYIFC